MAAKDFQLVRLKKGKTNFEVMVNHSTVQKFRKGELAIESVLYADIVFKNQVNPILPFCLVLSSLNEYCIDDRVREIKQARRNCRPRLRRVMKKNVRKSFA